MKPEKRKKGDIVIMAVGDIFVNRPDPPSIFEKVAPVLRQGDVVVGNLEAAICDRGAPVLGKVEFGSQYLRATPEQAVALKSAGFNLMSLANNHIMDYGPRGLFQTMSILEKNGISHAGGGRNLEDAHRPALLERNGVKVAFLSYTSIYPPAGHAADEDNAGLAIIRIHTSYESPENILYQPGYAPVVWTIPNADHQARMESDIRAARKNADIVMVALHGGISWGYGRPAGYQKELSRAAVDAGADLVMCAHPHALMAMEMYQSRLICYCMGNFVMDGVKQKHFGSDTMILKCRVKGRRIQGYSFVPARISDAWQPYVADGAEALAIQKKLEALSQEYGTTFDMRDGEVHIGGPRPGTPAARRGLSIEPHRGLPVLADSTMPIPSREMVHRRKAMRAQARADRKLK